MKIEVIAIQNDRELKAARSLVASLMGATSRRDVARLRAQAAVLAAVFEASTLTEAKARALWAQNPVM